MAKHKITWTMIGTIEYEVDPDVDDSDLDAVAADFQAACDDGYDFMRHGDVDGWEVDEVDGTHVHRWIGMSAWGTWDAYETCASCAAVRGDGNYPGKGLLGR